LTGIPDSGRHPLTYQGGGIMLRRASRPLLLIATAVLTLLATNVPPASAVPAFDFETPLFGLAAKGGNLFVADAGAGIVRLTDTGKLIVELPGVTDVVPGRHGRMWATTSEPRNFKLYKIADRKPHVVANLGRFEREVNPDGDIVESNPFDLAKLGGNSVLIADAAANALLVANREGEVDWVATLPEKVVPTSNAKDLAGCPNAPPELEEICVLPPEIPAHAVSTSVAVGPDGAYYVTELIGFPAPLGESRVWRIEAGTRNAHCDEAATDSPCSVVADGFTSIVDINFGPDGTAYVVELDEASWLAVEVGPDAMAGGTVNACDPDTWTCTESATDLTMPIAVAANASGAVFVAVSALIPGEAEVIELA
jgi:hypothetical protein